MKKLLSILLVVSMLFGMFAMTATAKTLSTAEVYDLRVNDLAAPMGIGDATPSFSWKMKSDAIGAAQSPIPSPSPPRTAHRCGTPAGSRATTVLPWNTPATR